MQENRSNKLLIEEATLEARFSTTSTPQERRAIRREYRPTRANIARAQKTGKEIIETQRSKGAICCFSEMWNQPLMWSHYAESHRGYCLKFKIRHELTDAYPDLVPLSVVYTEERPEVSMLDLMISADSLGSDEFREVSDRVFNALWYQKSSHWEYEREWRVNARSESGAGYKTVMCLELCEVILGASSDKRLPKIIRKRVDSEIPISKVVLDAARYEMGVVKLSL